MILILKRIMESNPLLKKVALTIYNPTLGAYLKQKENKNFLENGQKTLEQANLVFKEIGVDYWLEFGTLLGAIRNKSFIKHDFDLDLGMFLHDYSPDHEKIFNKYGFKKTKLFTIDDGRYGREETYTYLGVSLDIFYFTKKNDTKAYCHLFVPLEGKSAAKTMLELGGLVPKEFLLTIEKLGDTKFLGRKYPVPLACDKHLIDIYGSDYMIENPAWVTTREMNPSITILNDKVGVFKSP